MRVRLLTEIDILDGALIAAFGEKLPDIIASNVIGLKLADQIKQTLDTVPNLRAHATLVIPELL